MGNKLRVSVPYIEEVIGSKDAFEALAFCVLVKLNVKSSFIKNATFRKLKGMTRMGSARLQRILAYCKASGMLSVDVHNNMLIHSLPHGAEDNHTYFYYFTNRYAKRRRNTEVIFKQTITQVKDMLRRALIGKHVKVVQSIRQHVLLTKNPKNVGEYKKGKRFLRRLAVWGDTFFISNSRFAKVAKCGLSKARAIKKKMVEQGELQRSYSNTLVCGDANDFNIAEYARCYNDACFLFRDNGKVYKHNANVYNYKWANLCYVPKSNK